MQLPTQPASTEIKLTSMACMRGLGALLALVMLVAACGGSADEVAETTPDEQQPGASSEAGQEPASQTPNEGTSSTPATGEAASPTDDAALAEAAARLAAAREEPEFLAPGPPIDVAAVEGMQVLDIANTLSIPFTQILTDATTTALAEAGVENSVVDNTADPSETSRLIEQGISRGVDAIIVQSQEADLVAAPLRSARDAGIPVIILFEDDPRLPPESSAELGVVAEASFCYTCGGSLIADWIAVDSGGQANASVFWNPDVGISAVLNDGLMAQAEETCASCEIEYIDLLVSQWSDRLPTLTASALQNDDLTHLIPHFDGMISFMEPTIKQVGAEESVDVVSFNSDPPFMRLLQDGDTVDALVGSPVEWMGWAVADQTLRILAGMDPVPDENVPLRLFDEKNIGEIDLSQTESEWFGTDFRSAYRELWGL